MEQIKSRRNQYFNFNNGSNYYVQVTNLMFYRMLYGAFLSEWFCFYKAQCYAWLCFTTALFPVNSCFQQKVVINLPCATSTFQTEEVSNLLVNIVDKCAAKEPIISLRWEATQLKLN